MDRSERTEPNYHDIGGKDYGPVVRDERPLAHWEWEAEAVRALMGPPRLPHLSLDKLRRAFEEFGEDKYNRGFHERRTESMIHILLEEGVITKAELDTHVDAVAARFGLATKKR